MLPNFLCIGSQKAGTSWLYDMLKQNPEIWLPDIKEVHYYDYYYGEGTGASKWAPGHINKAVARIKSKKKQSNADIAYVNGLGLTKALSKEWYCALFNHADSYRAKVKGEVTPEYSAITEEGIKKIREDLGDIKIIWLIRDPLSRSISQAKMVLNRAGVDTNLVDYNNIDRYVRFKGRADYLKSMPLWEKYFSNILYIPYGDMKRDPVKLLNSVHDFLDVNGFAYKGASEVVHKTKSSKLTQSAIEALVEDSAPQYKYLESKFGSDFMERIK